MINPEMAGSPQADEQRQEMIERWARAAPGWGRQAARMREFAMPVSAWMLEQLVLQPGQRVLELAAGPGDTGFLAAELIQPGGTLISSDASDAMLAVARERARELGIENVEFRELQLEWIDLPTATVDAALCRWGVMLCLDPLAALRECRRVLRPGGRFALAVWDGPATNPWATIPTDALVKVGLAEPPDRDDPGPGMFALAAPGQLAEELADAGFLDVVVDSIPLVRRQRKLEEFVAETGELSLQFGQVWEEMSDKQRSTFMRELRRLAKPFTKRGGALELPARTLVGAAGA